MKKVIFSMLCILLLGIQSLTVLAAGEIPEERLLPRLVDEGDLLTDTQEAALLAKLDEISERQQCDVVIATVNTLGNKAATPFADDFFDYNGYGYGSGRDGILLVVCMEYRDYAISTHGYGITAFTDAGISYLEEQFLPKLSAGDYDTSFNTFADYCDAFLTQAKSGKPYDVNNMPGQEPLQVTPALVVGTIAIAYGIGILLALIVALIKRAGLNSVAVKTQANAYMNKFDLTMEKDRYIRSATTSHTVSKASQNSGGSSVHTSSSGSFHGGSSGKF